LRKGKAFSTFFAGWIKNEATEMKFLKMLAKPAGWASGGTSAILCFSAAIGFWGAGEPKRAIAWVVLGVAEAAALLL
jgi:hypothetical protein